MSDPVVTFRTVRLEEAMVLCTWNASFAKERTAVREGDFLTLIPTPGLEKKASGFYHDRVQQYRDSRSNINYLCRGISIAGIRCGSTVLRLVPGSFTER